MLSARTHFEAVKAGLPGDAARRADMLVQAEQLGLPTRRQESWHYTDLPQLLKRPLAGSDSEAVEDLPDFSAVAPFAVQFDNGRLTRALPSGETALSVTPFIGPAKKLREGRLQKMMPCCCSMRPWPVTGLMCK